jgi:hypothetical protein
MDEDLMRRAATALLHQIRRAAVLLPEPLSPPLRATRIELQRNLRLAFSLATVHQRAVVIEPTREAREGRLCFCLPEGVRWGRPDGIPLPPDLADSGWGSGRPRPLTVMPRRKAAANVWFLHDDRQALCLRLGLSGSVELLRYRPLLRAWSRC